MGHQLYELTSSQFHNLKLKIRVVCSRLIPEKIAIVSEEYPPHVIGGAGVFAYHLASWLSKKNIYTTVFSGGSSKPIKEKVNAHLDVVRLPSLNLPPRYLWFQLQNARNISRYLINSPSLIHSTTPEVSPFCSKLKKLLKKPLVTSYHGVTRYEMASFLRSPFSQWTLNDFSFHVLEYPLYDMMNRLSLRDSDYVVTCSKAILAELHTSYKNIQKSSVIFNGIDLYEIDSIKSDLSQQQITNCHLTIVFYGRLSWLKGVLYLIAAFRLLSNNYPTLKLRIYGEGPLGSKIQKLIVKLHLENKIILMGQMVRERLIGEIKSADIVVLPSLREAQPIAVLEAMACKKPVIAFDFPFAREYIKHSYNGLLAKAYDVTDLADKIRALLCDSGLRNELGQNGYDYVKVSHNWETIVDQYINVYDKITSA